MINGAYYAEVLRQPRREIVKKRRKLTQGVLLLQDNTAALTSQAAMAAATKILPHPYILQI